MTAAVRVGVSGVEASAIVQADSTTQGVLVPRMTGTQRDAISSPATGLLVYNTDTDTLDYYDGTDWQALEAPGAVYLELAGGTMSGTLALADNLVTRPVIKDYGETVNAIGSVGGGTQDIDLEAGNVVSATVDTSETTFTFSHPPASGTAGSFTLILTNGGSQTVNWPASVNWAGGAAPELTAAGVDVLTFLTVDAGTTWHGFAAGLDMS
jgi:hypothetical protein